MIAVVFTHGRPRHRHRRGLRRRGRRLQLERLGELPRRRRARRSRRRPLLPRRRRAPSTSAPASTSAGPDVVKVDVLNQSAGSGSAKRTATDLREAGWEIGRVDDFSGNVSTTTVYWLSPENRRQARQISRFLGGVRVQEGFDTLVDGRVSVVLVEPR